jgi:methyl-accepting chemotaxis protein
LPYQHKRRLVNYLLQPAVQLRFGVVNVALSLLFVGGLGAYSYSRFVQFAEVVTTLTQANEEIATLLTEYLSGVATTAAASGLLFIVVSLVASVYLSHKLVGPTVAFRRHIGRLIDGDFAAKTSLRQGDAFREVAEDLNRLSERLQRLGR